MADLTFTQNFFEAANKLGRRKGKVIPFLNKFAADSSSKGLNIEPVKSASPGIHSARVDDDIRVIFLKHAGRVLLLHVDQHDPAYAWARRRRVEFSESGEFRLIVVPEVIEQAVAEVPPPPPETVPLFASNDDDYLCSLGLPPIWLPPIRKMQHVDQLYEAFDRTQDLPKVWERLIQLAKGEPVFPDFTPTEPASLGDTPSSDGGKAWVVDEENEGWQIPFSEWRRFLHPKQMELVEAEFTGPVIVTGMPGTGKSLVGLHRAVRLAGEGKHVLLATYTKSLRRYLESQLRGMCPKEVADRVEVVILHRFASNILKSANRPCRVAEEADCETVFNQRLSAYNGRLSNQLLVAEWEQLILRQGIETLDEYLEANRVGRGTRMSAVQRQSAWELFGPTLDDVAKGGIVNFAFLCRKARNVIATTEHHFQFDAVIADEVQDFNNQEIRLLAALATPNPAGLMLLGDAGQRIYPGGFTLKDLGIEIANGHRKRLNVAYRSGERIRRFAERLLTRTRDDMEGGKEEASGFGLRLGAEPRLQGFGQDEEQDTFVVEQIRQLLERGYEESEIAVIARSGKHLNRILKSLRAATIRAVLESDSAKHSDDSVTVVTMHSAKGLEFRAVFVINCQHGQMPNYAVTEGLAGDELAVAENLERQLLYVSMTRAREELFILWVKRPSEFIEPFIRRPADTATS